MEIFFKKETEVEADGVVQMFEGSEMMIRNSENCFLGNLLRVFI